MSLFHLPCFSDKITQRRVVVVVGGGAFLFERQMNSYTPPGSLRKSMARGFPRSAAASPLLMGEMILSRIVDNLWVFFFFLKNDVMLKKKKKKKKRSKREHKQTGIPRG